MDAAELYPSLFLQTQGFHASGTQVTSHLEISELLELLLTVEKRCYLKLLKIHGFVRPALKLGLRHTWDEVIPRPDAMGYQQTLFPLDFGCVMVKGGSEAHLLTVRCVAPGNSNDFQPSKSKRRK